MKRRIIAALMCLCMLVGLLPMSAFAADPGTVKATKEVVSQAPDENGNYTIKLTVQGEPVESSSASAADVVLVVDNSGSMASSVGEPCETPKSEFHQERTYLWYQYTCPNCGAKYSSSLLGLAWDTRPEKCTGQKGAEKRIDTAKEVSKAFAQSILNGENANQLAVIGFAHKSENGGPDDSDALFVTQSLTNDLTQANSAINKMNADGGTNYSAALHQAYTWLNYREDTSRPAYVIFISDGAPGLSGESISNSQWNGSAQAAALKQDGVTLYTIGIALTEDESEYLESLATDPSHYINVTGTNYAAQLEKVMSEWASHINSVPAGKNAVMTDVVNTDYFDVVTSLPAGVTLGNGGKTLTWNIGNIPKDGVSVEFKIKPKDSFLNSFTGTQTVYTNTDVSLKYKDYKNINQTIPKAQIGDPTVTLTGTKPAEYTLTYNGNAQSGGTVDNMPTDNNTYLIGVTVPLSGQVPTYTAADGTTKVLFVGWTETENTKIYGKNDTAPTTVTSVTMAEGGKTVYAAWGYDVNGDGNPDVNENGYKLTYQENNLGGTVDNMPTDNNTYLIGVTVPLSGQVPTYTAADGTTKVLFVGWTETENTKIYGKNDTAPTTVTSVTMAEGGKTVYAAWGYDVNGDGNPDVNENGYKLTYQENNLGGTVGNMPTDNNTYLIGVTVPLSGQVPTYTAADGKKVLFVGWTESENSKIYDKNDTVTTVPSVTMGSSDKHVYAAWGYDANNNDIPDVNETGHALIYHENTLGVGDTVVGIPTDDNTYLSGVTVPLSGQVPTYTAADGKNVVFIGWTESENSKIYDKNDTVTTVPSVTMGSSDKHVYAAWGYDANGNGTADATEVNVTFEQGAHGTFVDETGPKTVSVVKGGKLGNSQIPSVSANTNYTFTGWKSSVDSEVYTKDALLTLAIGQATTFTAQYTYNDPGQGGIQYDHHLYYHSNFGKDQKANEGTDKDGVVVKDYDELKILSERDGYVFVSWNTEKDGSGTPYLPGAVFKLTNSEHHLYAQWQKDKTGPDDSGVSNWLETDEHNAYLTGYPDSTFRADRNMTRAEVAQMFYALLLDKNVTITKSFSDVPDDAWYSTAVKTLASLGMMDGYPDGTFRPDEPITRAEFATVGLAFAYDPLDASCSYYDVGANAWYYTYVAQATTYGWIGGYPDNTFRPGNNITRVEVCVIVNNMLGRDADERYIDRHEDELVHFVDLSDSYWGYYTIMESTNTHEYTGSFTNEKWTDVK